MRDLEATMLSLADAPPTTGSLLRQAASKLGLTVLQILLLLGNHLPEFLKIAAEFASGNTTQAVNDLVALVQSLLVPKVA